MKKSKNWEALFSENYEEWLRERNNPQVYFNSKDAYGGLFRSFMLVISKEMAKEIPRKCREEFGEKLHILMQEEPSAKKIRGFLYRCHAEGTRIRDFIRWDRLPMENIVYLNIEGIAYNRSELSDYISRKFEMFRYKEEGLAYATFLEKVIEKVSLNKMAKLDGNCITLIESDRPDPPRELGKYVHMLNKINPRRLEDEILNLLGIRGEICVSTFDANHLSFYESKFGVVLGGELETLFDQDCYSIIRKDGKRIATDWGNEARPEGWAIPSNMTLEGIVCSHNALSLAKPVALKYRVPLYIIEKDNYIYGCMCDHIYAEDDIAPPRKRGVRKFRL
ncbi:MAG: hypothetical protein RBR68_15085 [Tenuifilaceae bacterium]|nr:hypothetical protein [Tenuifilaceae bacterium]